MIPRGLLRLAMGRADGIKEFGNSAEAVTASLAPLIAFPLVTAGLSALGGQAAFGVLYFLARLCAVLALPAIIYEAARFAKTLAFWQQTVAALNWSFWPMLVLVVGAYSFVVVEGLPPGVSGPLLGLLLLYLLWYQWFIVRTGLRLHVLAALAVVVINDVVLVLLSLAPVLFTRMLHVPVA